MLTPPAPPAPSAPSDVAGVLEAATDGCDAAHGPDRPLDVRIALAQPDRFFNAGPRWEGAPDSIGELLADGRRSLPGNAPDMLVPAYTGSLDAAMQLVPDGWEVERLGQCYGGRARGRWECSLYTRNPGLGSRSSTNDPFVSVVDCATPALALASAALRARAALAAGSPQ